MSILSRSGIEQLIQTWKETYQINPATLISGFHQENQTVQDYEGRQLLELMQNADDAKSDCIIIALDTVHHILSIANNGDSFTLEGVESLMYTGLSTKNKEEYIGNKGLGFRSILSWANKISILTREVSFAFSRAYSESFYDSELIKHTKVSERVQDEIRSKKLPVDTKIIAALAFPEIIDEVEKDFVTKVEMEFKPEFLSTIQDQINTITEELLLFLPHVKTIKVTIDGKEEKHLQKTVDEVNLITINATNWHILRSDTKVYKGSEGKSHRYKYAIAWKDDLSIIDGRFYTYFPTDVETNLPCIIHATFDLTNNRKEINNTEANKHILQDIVQALGLVAHDYFKKNTVDWKPYTFLTPRSNANRAVLKEFYTSLQVKREAIGVYPTVDEKYILRNDAYYNGDSFSNWVVHNGFGKYFKQLIQALCGVTAAISKEFPIQILYDNIVSINEALTLEQRVELIGLFAIKEKGYFSSLHESDVQLPLLLSNNGDIVSESIKVFTKNTAEDSLEFPDYIKDVVFISVPLFQKIKEAFKDEIQLEKYESESGDARAIKRLLDPAVNIGLDDITGVIQHVISETNKLIKDHEKPYEIVKAMVTSLYSIFRSNPDRRGNLSTINNIPLIAKDGSIQNSENLYFGADYSIGKSAALLFEGVRTAQDYLAAISTYELKGEENDILNFFKWLNVNLFSKEEEVVKKLGRWDNDDFVKFVFKDLDNQREDVYKNYHVKTLVNIENYLKNELFSVEKLIAWIALDNKFYDELRAEHSNTFTVSFGPETKQISLRKSYLFFVINSSGILKNCILGNECFLGNHFKIIHPTSDFFKKLNISEYKVLEIIDLLAIKKTINEFPPDYIYSMLNEYNNEGKNSQTFYKMMYEYFRENETTQLKEYPLNFNGLQYFARKGGIGDEFSLIPVNEVYYSDNKLLPQAVLDNYWFINLPKRIGENRVRKFFGVKLIKDIVNQIEVKVDVVHGFNRELNKYLIKLKPYLLSYRLSNLSKPEDKKEAANSIKKVTFCLAKVSFYKTTGVEPITFKEYDFIYKDDVCTIQYGRSANLEILQKDSLFCDVIAELFCVLFKVGDQKNSYRRVFKDGVSETLHILKTDDQELLLQEAYSLLGVSLSELVFWNKVFPGVNFNFDSDDELLRAIESKLGLTLPSEYGTINFEEWYNEASISFLKWIKSVCKIDLNKLITPEQVKVWHLNQIDNYIKDQLTHFEKLLWIQANDSVDEKLKREFYKKAREFEDAKDTLYTKLKLDNAVNLDVDYIVEVFKYSKDQFSIDLNEVIHNDFKIEAKYDEVISKYNFGDHLQDMFKIIKNEDVETYSLLYFEGFESQIKKFCDACQDSNKQQRGLLQEDDLEDLEIFEGHIESGEIKVSSKKGGKSNDGSHTSQKNKKKSIHGLRAETKVKLALEKAGYKVNPKSEKTDSFHYDMEYKKEGETQWRKLEIKKDSGGFFYLSKHEKETALKEENALLYDVAIVNDKGIFIVKSMFNLGEDTFERNSRFVAEPSEYTIHFKLGD